MAHCWPDGGRSSSRCSTRAAAGVYPDRGGALLVETLRGWGCEVADAIVVPDGPAVGETLAAALPPDPTFS